MKFGEQPARATDMKATARQIARPNTSFLSRVVEGAKSFIRDVRGDTFMSPMQPIEPMIPPDQTGRPLPPRAFDYNIGVNVQINPREGYAVSYDQLRNLADSYDILRLLLETRKDQVRRQPWGVRAKIDKKTKKPLKADAEAFAQNVENFMMFPDRQNDFETWVGMLLEEMLVPDAASVWVRPSRVAKVPYAFEIIAGDTVVPKIALDGRRPDPPDVAYQQIIHGVPFYNFTADELVYAPRNKRVHRVYGFSPVEQIIMTANIAIRRAVSQLQEFTEGTTPDTWASLPKDWSLQMIREFQADFNNMMNDTADRRKVRFLPGETHVERVRPLDLKDSFDEWLTRISCFALSIPPQPFVREMNRATAEAAQTQAKEEGIVPTNKWVKNTIDRCIYLGFGRDDIEFYWEEENDVDPQTQSVIDASDVASGIALIDEVRAKRGLDPHPNGVGSVPLILKGTPMTLEALSKVTEAPTPVAPPPGNPGAGQSGKDPGKAKDGADGKAGAKAKPGSEPVKKRARSFTLPMLPGDAHEQLQHRVEAFLTREGSRIASEVEKAYERRLAAKNGYSEHA